MQSLPCASARPPGFAFAFHASGVPFALGSHAPSKLQRSTKAFQLSVHDSGSPFALQPSWHTNSFHSKFSRSTSRLASSSSLKPPALSATPSTCSSQAPPSTKAKHVTFVCPSTTTSTSNSTSLATSASSSISTSTPSTATSVPVIKHVTFVCPSTTTSTSNSTSLATSASSSISTSTLSNATSVPAIKCEDDVTEKIANLERMVVQITSALANLVSVFNQDLAMEVKESLYISTKFDDRITKLEKKSNNVDDLEQKLIKMTEDFDTLVKKVAKSNNVDYFQAKTSLCVSKCVEFEGVINEGMNKFNRAVQNVKNAEKKFASLEERMSKCEVALDS